MQRRSFFTRQRYIILAAGMVLFVLFIFLGTLLGHASEFGILFIDLSSSAITIIATALVIEYFQFREESDRTHHVAAIAEEEIKAVCYRVKLAVTKLYGFTENAHDQRGLASLKDVERYLQDTTGVIDGFYHQDQSKKITAQSLKNFKADCVSLQNEIETAINLFDYALPHSLRTAVLTMRARLQINERVIGFMPDSALSEDHITLVNELTDSVFKAVQDVLRHESRTHENISIARKPGRLTR